MKSVKPARVLLRAVLVLLVLAGVLGVVVTRDVFWRRVILPAAGRAAGAEISADAVRFRPGSLLELEGVRFVQDDGLLTAEAERVSVRYQLSRVLRDAPALDRIEVVNPLVVVREAVPAEAPAGASAGTSAGADRPEVMSGGVDAGKVAPEGQEAVKRWPVGVDVVEVTGGRVRVASAEGEVRLAGLDAGLRNVFADLPVGVQVSVDALLRREEGSLLRVRAGMDGEVTVGGDFGVKSVLMQAGVEVLEASGAFAAGAEVAKVTALAEGDPGFVRRLEISAVNAAGEILGRVRGGGVLDVFAKTADVEVAVEEVGPAVLNLLGAAAGAGFGDGVLSAEGTVRVREGGASVDVVLEGALDGGPVSAVDWIWEVPGVGVVFRGGVRGTSASVEQLAVFWGGGEEGESRLEAEGSVSFGDAEALGVSGSVRAERLDFRGLRRLSGGAGEGLVVEGLEVRGALAGGRVELEGLRAVVNGAEVTAEGFAVPGDAEGAYRLAGRLMPLRLGPFLDLFAPEFAAAAGGVLEGEVSVEGMGLSGAAMRAGSTGSVRVLLTEGEVSLLKMPEPQNAGMRTGRRLMVVLLRALAPVLGVEPEALLEPFLEEIRLEGRLDRGELVLKTLRVENELLEVEMAGVMTLAEEVGASRIPDFPVRVSLETNVAKRIRVYREDRVREGRVALPPFVQVRGTLEEPVVDVRRRVVSGLVLGGVTDSGVIKDERAQQILEGLGGVLSGEGVRIPPREEKGGDVPADVPADVPSGDVEARRPLVLPTPRPGGRTERVLRGLEELFPRKEEKGGE